MPWEPNNCSLFPVSYRAVAASYVFQDGSLQDMKTDVVAEYPWHPNKSRVKCLEHQTYFVILPVRAVLWLQSLP
eukprot:scaffold6514_cov102-Cylindrotheca_fusiformis.AAC.4